MEKELFIEVIDKMRDLYDKENIINKVLTDNIADSSLYIYDEPLDFMGKLLAKLMNDEGDWISYYAWEQDFGREHKSGDVSKEDGTPIPLFNAEDLYNLLTAE